jgi:hypothetical protein
MTSRNLTANFFEFRNRATRDRSFRADDKVCFTDNTKQNSFKNVKIYFQTPARGKN